MKFLKPLFKKFYLFFSARGSEKENSLQFEIHDSLRSSRKSSKHSSRIGSSRLSSGPASVAGHGAEGHDFKRAFNTFKVATANKMPRGAGFGETSPVPVSRGYRPGQGSSLDNSVKESRPGQPDSFISVGDGIRYLPNDSFYSYTVSRDDSQSPVDFLNLSEELEGMMSTSYDDCFNNDDDDGVISNANCIQVRFDPCLKKSVCLAQGIKEAQ